MNSEQIEALADRIIALINSQLRSPTRVEIVNTILSVNCDPRLQQPPDAHTLSTTNSAVTTGSYTGSVLTMADVLKIARDEADHANKMFGYAGLTFAAKLDPITDNLMVVAECSSNMRPALGFAVTHKAIVAPDAAAIKSAIGVQCFRLGEMMLNAVPERFHS
mgnify:CR=1 FL=1